MNKEQIKQKICIEIDKNNFELVNKIAYQVYAIEQANQTLKMQEKELEKLLLKE